MYYIVINKYYTNLIKQELVVMLNSHIKTKTQKKTPQTFNFSSTPNWKNRRIVLAQLIEKKMKIVSDVNL